MRVASMLAVASLFMALGSGCAVDQGESAGLEEGTPGVAAMGEDPEPQPEDYHQLQAPPVKLKMRINDVPFLAMFSLRDPVGNFAGQMEHWFTSPVQTTLPLAPPSITIGAVPLATESESSIYEWAAPLGLTFSCPRVVKPTDWRQGAVVLPPELTAHLYWTAHPDNDQEILGVVLATDRDNHIVSTAWYRSMAPDASGRAFASTRWSHSLVEALDANGMPSADPNDIRVADWYSITMGP